MFSYSYEVSQLGTWSRLPKYQTAIIVPHNYRLEMGHPRTARNGDGGWLWRRTRPAHGYEESDWNKNFVLQGDIIQNRTALNAIRPSILESEVLRRLGGATCPPSLCSFTVEHVRGSPPASQISSASSVAKLLRFGPVAKSFPPNKL